jgi:pyruvate dehydrogenase E1 component
VPESIRAFVPAPYVTLGTDGFGRSDTRASLRDFFEVDAKWIAYSALVEVYGDKKSPEEMRDIASKLELNLNKPIASSI